ncbi:MAG: thioredoxin domain-containing protein [Geobacteraceae bacterium]|nr:thioredoxin domain-containing protein [Geobacteraceae bacterium]
MRFTKIRTFAATIIAFSTLASAAHAEPMTKEQGDAILTELRQIKQLLQKPQQLAQPAPQAPKADEPATVSVAGVPFLGKADAPLTLVMFTDYQCPFCSRFETQTLPEIKRQYIDTGKLRFVVRDMPLPFHPYASKAAEATHCAEEQGKYWELREKLVANGDKLDAKLLPEYARQVGLDVAKFSACLESGRQAEKVRASSSLAASIGISGTPSFVIGRSKGDRVEGVTIVGAQPFAAFDQKLKELLGK